MVASIAVAALSDAGLDRARAYAARHDGLSLLILHDGGVVLEDYPVSGPDDAHALHSGTKSFRGVLAGTETVDGQAMIAVDLEGEEHTALVPFDWIVEAKLILTDQLLKLGADRRAAELSLNPALADDGGDLIEE